MKKLFIALSAALTLLGFTACDNDDKDNVLVMPAPDSMVLQTPANASADWVLDKANSFQLSASEAQFGSVGPVQYGALVSLDETFEKTAVLNPTDNSTNNMTFKESDFNYAINTLYGYNFDTWEDLGYVPVYVKTYYNLAGNESTYVYSNPVKFESVAFYRPSPLTTGNPVGIYLRGGMNDWGADPAWEFVTTSDGNVFELRNVNIPVGTEFKVADADWADINYGGDDDNKGLVTPDEPFELTYNGTNLHMDIDFIGNIQLINDHGTYSVVFTVTDSSAPTGIFLRGDMNGWGADPAWEFKSTQFSNTYELEGVTIGAGVGFKVADANWNPIDYGYNGGTPLEFDTDYPLDHGGANITLAADFTGSVYLTVDGDSYSLRFEPYLPDQPSGIFLMGGMNGWSASAEWEFLTTASKSEWVIASVTIDEGTEFKAANASWSPIDLGANDALEFGKPLDLVYQGPNIKMPATATVKVTLKKSGEDYTLTMDPL